jgi:putative transposase
MTPKESMARLDEIFKVFKQKDADFQRQALEKMYNILMEEESQKKIGAGRYERSEERTNWRNGYRERPLDTTVGTLNLQIPKLRQGSYYPEILEPRRMVDQALVNVIQEAYIHGVSTRKVDSVVESLGLSVDKSAVARMCKELDAVITQFKDRPLEKKYPYLWLDATFPKVREDHRVQNMALVVAIGVTHEGDREVLGFDVGISEDRSFWELFLRRLVERGLKGVKLVISDSHAGLKQAAATILSGATWQRCRVHFMRNVLCHVQKGQQNLVAAILRTIFAADNQATARGSLRQVVKDLEGRFPRAMSVVEEAEDDVLAFMTFPSEHWPQLYSTNPLERLNKEIRRRINVVSIFPNRASVIRLVGSVLLEQHDEWVVGRRYFSADSMAKLYGTDYLSPEKSTLLLR